MSERGVFGVDRGIWDHPVFAERRAFSRREAWLWMLSEAAWKQRRARVPGSVFALERGQFVHSIRFMAKAWGWEQTRVVRFLEQLKTETMIATRLEAGHTVTTICNYDKYQKVGLPSATSDATPDAAPAQQDRNANATNKKKEITEEGNLEGDVRGREVERLSEDFYRTIGVDPQNPELAGYAGLPHHVSMWLERGYDRGLILATAADIHARAGPSKPLNYYAKAIENAHIQGPPKTPERQNGTLPGNQNRGGSVLDALDKITGRIRSGADSHVVFSLPKS